MSASNFFEEDILHLAVRIVVIPPSHTRQSIGTGFLYEAHLNDGTNRSITFVVSNKHVFENPLGTLQIHINRKNIEGGPDYGNIYTFEARNFSSLYFPHPDEEVDLACVNVSDITHRNVFIRNLDEKFISKFDASKVLVSSDVIFVGYPYDRYDVRNNLPIVRKGSIASLPSLNFNGKSQILIDAQVFEGSSGSPVFTVIDDKYYLLGVVSQTMIRHSMLQTLQANYSNMGVKQILGLGIVIKQINVRELIDFAVSEFLKKEKNHP